MSILRSLFSRRERPAFRPPRPEERFYAVGDIHGRADLLQALIARIDTEDPEARLVFVGDYIDRGDRSKEVLDMLQSLHRPAAPPTVFLMGNHERMCLDYLDNPEVSGTRWLRNGGVQTVSSYCADRTVKAATPNAMRDMLFDAMGPETHAWLQNLALSWRTGNVAVAHAAVDPAIPFEMQASSTFLWGHPDFFRHPRHDGLWVVHGHTIVEEATAFDGRIAVDTGAYTTGQLTAARVAPDEIRFLST